VQRLVLILSNDTTTTTAAKALEDPTTTAAATKEHEENWTDKICEDIASTRHQSYRVNNSPMLQFRPSVDQSNCD
jgi:hypothetical protein